MDDFKVIAVTSEEIRPGEAQRIERMLRSGAVWRVHVRHPGASEEETRAVVEAVPSELRSRLTLHDYPALALDAGTGLQLNGRMKSVPEGFAGMLSRSCHSIDEAEASTDADYVTLSPIYDSISKQGYRSAFDTGDMRLRNLTGRRRVIALGGVTPAHFNELKEAGFAGAALKGRLDAEGAELERKIKQLKMKDGRFRLQFITDSPTTAGTVEQARQAIRGGCRWVQVRMKGSTAAEAAEALRQIAEAEGAEDVTLIVDDHVEVAKLPFVDGVHLGQTDMAVDEARQILGEEKIIGLTVNNMDHARTAAGVRPDYIGTGPWRYTKTKANLAPLLGEDGIKEILGYLHGACGEIPAVAIGGIRADDAEGVARAGAQGVAVAGAISRADNPTEETRKFLTELKKYIS